MASIITALETFAAKGGGRPGERGHANKVPVVQHLALLPPGPSSSDCEQLDNKPTLAGQPRGR